MSKMYAQDKKRFRAFGLTSVLLLVSSTRLSATFGTVFGCSRNAVVLPFRARRKHL